MRKGIVLDANDIKEIIAKHYNVSPDKVIKSQYSYTVITDDKEIGEGKQQPELQDQPKML